MPRSGACADPGGAVPSCWGDLSAGGGFIRGATRGAGAGPAPSGARGRSGRRRLQDDFDRGEYRRQSLAVTASAGVRTHQRACWPIRLSAAAASAQVPLRLPAAEGRSLAASRAPLTKLHTATTSWRLGGGEPSELSDRHLHPSARPGLRGGFTPNTGRATRPRISRLSLAGRQEQASWATEGEKAKPSPKVPNSQSKKMLKFAPPPVHQAFPQGLRLFFLDQAAGSGRQAGEGIGTLHFVATFAGAGGARHQSHGAESEPLKVFLLLLGPP